MLPLVRGNLDRNSVSSVARWLSVKNHERTVAHVRGNFEHRNEGLILNVLFDLTIT